jgi:hypothetical protein
MSVIEIFAEQAFERLKTNPHAAWPKRDEQSDRFSDIVFNPSFKIQKDDKVFCIGSCFARNIEEHLVDLGYDVVSYDAVLPEEHGRYRRRNWVMINFNPISMENELNWALSPNKSFPGESAFIKIGCKYYDPHSVPGLPCATVDDLMYRRQVLYDTYRRVVDAREC